jgi:hypothetical protein
MQASQPIRPPKSPTDGHLGTIGLLVVLGLVVAILKPWGSQPGTTLLPPPPTLAPSPAVTPVPTPDIGFGGRVYDRSIFGEHEPEAAWGIWPAGYLTTFGFVIQVPATPAPPSPTSLVGPSASAILGGDDAGPSWPARLDMPDGDHLLLIGIDMPPGETLSLFELDGSLPGGSSGPQSIIRLASPWPSHFAVLGIATATDAGLLEVWPPGTYQLHLSFAPGEINRTIEIQIAGPAAGS